MSWRRKTGRPTCNADEKASGGATEDRGAIVPTRFPLSTIFLLLLGVLSVKAATLKGVVLANELGGPPMENVDVDAISGTNHTVSDSSGKFTLEFPQRGVGETVRIIVQKDGYEVVNDVQLEATLSADPNSKPLIILLCKDGDREEMARRFYRLKSNEAIESTYQQKLKVLEKERQADATALAQLQQERDQARATGEKTSNQLAKNQAGENSQFYRQAKRLFLAGEIEEAIKLVTDNEEKRREWVAQTKQATGPHNQLIDNAVQEWLLEAQ